MDSRSRHTSKTKVKSGCRTCKTRKVKCDEDRPACQRCISTGRVCDGYGIWGGGGNAYGSRQHPASLSRDTSVVPRPPTSVLPIASDSEMLYFEWFKYRTATKLSGSFISGFWSNLLLQSSLSEPAVLHAILALSSVHKGGIIDSEAASDGKRKRSNMPDEHEQFMLRHYVKAISHLQTRFSRKDRTSSRVALITCVVFISLELLRGHFNTALVHFYNGLKILEEMRILPDKTYGIVRLTPCRESTDDWIVDAFSRLHLQVELFRQSSSHASVVLLRENQTDAPAAAFHSFNEAWKQMERLMNKIFHLDREGLKLGVPNGDSIWRLQTLLEHREQTQTELDQWLAMYEAFNDSLEGRRSAYDTKCYPLLSAYYLMADIMVRTSLRPNDESIFDSHTIRFAALVGQLVHIRSSDSPSASPNAIPGGVDMPRSVVDMGWIPPLYYTAVKCRVHRIRLQAVRLLESTSHREGIWDASIAACVARKVMRIEERDFYEGTHLADDFLLPDPPRPQDLTLPALPDSYRLREVEVVLSGGPVDSILLFCNKRPGDVDGSVLVSQYSVHTQSWKDGKGEGSPASWRQDSSPWSRSVHGTEALPK